MSSEETAGPKSETERIATEAADLARYMPLVRQEAARCFRRVPSSVQRDDLVAAGTFGLIDALRRKEEVDRGPAFEAYARIRIRGAIFDELRAQDWLSRRARVKAEPGATITTLSSLPDGESSRASTSTPPPTPHDLVEQESTNKVLARAVESLPDRERRIVDMHYFQGVQLKTIAVTLGVSEPRISQLHARATKILRAWLNDLEANEGFAPKRTPRAA